MDGSLAAALKGTIGAGMSESQKPVGSGGSTLEAVVAAAHDTAGAFSTLERQLRQSRSFHDVQAVDAGHALSPPPLKKLRKSQDGRSLLETSLRAVQEDENEVAEVVVVCEPEGMHTRNKCHHQPLLSLGCRALACGFITGGRMDTDLTSLLLTAVCLAMFALLSCTVIQALR